MENQIIQSPQITKISQSTLQFRQLISSLRTRQRLSKVQQYHPINSQKQMELSSESTVAAQPHKLTPISINPQQQNILKQIPKLAIAGRDLLRHRDHQIPSDQQKIAANEPKISSKERSLSLLAPAILKQSYQKQQKQKINVSTQYDPEPVLREQSIESPRNLKAGLIVRQGRSLSSHKQHISKSIRELNEVHLLDYLTKEKRLDQKSQPSQIFLFFTNLCLACGVIVKTPSIKKYKNCVYFGYPLHRQENHEGFLYFYDNKIYYGEFLNGLRHGRGVELHLTDNIKFQGEFKEGQKSGKFIVQKSNQKYIGYIQNGVYQGEGRLSTNDCIYEGQFDKGQKNGYGQQFYPKTGVKIAGYFQNGILEKTKISKSNPQFKTKNKLTIKRDKQKLEKIKKTSFQKHNQRMNKIKEKSSESQYDMQSEFSQEYREPPKISFNISKLEMYRQAPKKLPKKCQEFQNSIDNSSSKYLDSTRSPYEQMKPTKKLHYRRDIQRTRGGSLLQRIQITDYEQPLPTPCLTLMRLRR